MLIAGLTGSIGMGKSTIAKRFSMRGVPVIDADGVVHDLYRGDAVAPIEAVFPGVATDGVIDRAKLMAVLMKDEARFKQLEAIVHPLVHKAQADLMRRHKREGAWMTILENPLLYEMNGDVRVDYTVVVSAPAKVQRERVMAREGMTAEKFESILSRQVPDAEKRRRADFVVDTGQTIEQSWSEVDKIVAALKLRKGTAFQDYWAEAGIS